MTSCLFFSKRSKELRTVSATFFVQSGGSWSISISLSSSHGGKDLTDSGRTVDVSGVSEFLPGKDDDDRYEGFTSSNEVLGLSRLLEIHHQTNHFSSSQILSIDFTSSIYTLIIIITIIAFDIIILLSFLVLDVTVITAALFPSLTCIHRKSKSTNSFPTFSLFSPDYSYNVTSKLQRSSGRRGQ